MTKISGDSFASNLERNITSHNSNIYSHVASCSRFQTARAGFQTMFKISPHLPGLKNCQRLQDNLRKTARDIKVKHTARKGELKKVVGNCINKILEEKIKEVDKVYEPACQSLSTQSEKISNYLQKVKKSLQRANDVLEDSKLEELLTAQKNIDDDIRMLQNEKPQNLTTFQVQVANPESCMEEFSFYQMFQELTVESCKYVGISFVAFQILLLISFSVLEIVFSDHMMSDTVILKNESELIRQLLSFLNDRKSPLRLCYRASIHGWQSQKFHELCDSKAGTVVLVKVGNWIFGGYIDQTWQGKTFIPFIFMLSNQQSVELFFTFLRRTILYPRHIQVISKYDLQNTTKLFALSSIKFSN